MPSETDRCDGVLMDNCAMTEYDEADQLPIDSTTTCSNTTSRPNDMDDTAPTLGYYFTNSRSNFKNNPQLVWCYGVSNGMSYSFVPTSKDITAQRSLQADLEAHFEREKGEGDTRRFEMKLYDLGHGGEWLVPDFARMMNIPRIKKKHTDCTVTELTNEDIARLMTEGTETAATWSEWTSTLYLVATPKSADDGSSVDA